MRGIEKSGKGPSLRSATGRVTVGSCSVTGPVGLSWLSATVPIKADTAPRTITVHLSTCKTIFNMVRDSEVYLSFCDSEPKDQARRPWGTSTTVQLVGQSILLACGKVKDANLASVGGKTHAQFPLFGFLFSQSKGSSR